MIAAAQLDSLFACPSSVMHPDGMLRVITQGDAPEASAAIRLLGQHVHGAPFDLPGECDKRHADRERVAAMVAYGVKAWADLRQPFQGEMLLVNRAIPSMLDGQSLNVRIDVLQPAGPLFLAWFPQPMAEGYAQRMIGSAWSLWQRLNRPKELIVRGVAVFLHNQIFRVFKYGADELAEWEAEATAKVKAGGYNVGPACARCPIFASCPARRAVAEHVGAAYCLANREQAIKYLAGATEDNRDAPELREAIDDMTMLTRLAQADIDLAKELIRGVVVRLGPIRLASGLSLVNRRFEQRTLDPVKAWRVLRSHLPDAEILEAARLSLPRLLAAKSASYGRGEKDTARATLEQDLQKAGAVNVTETFRLDEVDLEQEKDSEHPGDDSRAQQRSGGTDVGASAGGREQQVGGGGAAGRPAAGEPRPADGNAQGA